MEPHCAMSNFMESSALASLRDSPTFKRFYEIVLNMRKVSSAPSVRCRCFSTRLSQSSPTFIVNIWLQKASIPLSPLTRTGHLVECRAPHLTSVFKEFHSTLASFIEFFPNKPREIGENYTRVSKTDQYLTRKTCRIQAHINHICFCIVANYVNSFWAANPLGLKTDMHQDITDIR